jgi:hypothetical protein
LEIKHKPSKKALESSGVGKEDLANGKRVGNWNFVEMEKSLKKGNLSNHTIIARLLQSP